LELFYNYKTLRNEFKFHKDFEKISESKLNICWFSLNQAIFMKKSKTGSKIKLEDLSNCIERFMNENIAEKMFVKIIKSKYKLLCFFQRKVFPFIFKFISHLNDALNTKAVYMYGALDAKTLIHNVRSMCFEDSKKHILCSQKTILKFIKKKLEQKKNI